MEQDSKLSKTLQVIIKMPKNKQGKENKPTYKTKEAAEKHGYMTYGKTKTGGKKFRVYKVSKGWNVSKTLYKKK